MTLPLRFPYAPMEAHIAPELPRGGEWQYEPKWDGFRCIAFRDGDKVRLQSKAGKPLERFAAKYLPRSGSIALSRATKSLATANRWLAGAGIDTDGVVAKRLDLPYQSGNRDGMIKVKRIRSADCVVGGFRYAAKGKSVGSLLLGLHDADGRLNHVGFCSGLDASVRKGLTARLEALVEPPGFTGRAPGRPSRWNGERSTAYESLAPKLVVEVSYDHVTDGRFRHGTRFLRWRPDKAPSQCTMEQLEQD